MLERLIFLGLIISLTSCNTLTRQELSLPVNCMFRAMDHEGIYYELYLVEHLDTLFFLIQNDELGHLPGKHVTSMNDSVKQIILADNLAPEMITKIDVRSVSPDRMSLSINGDNLLFYKAIGDFFYDDFIQMTNEEDSMFHIFLRGRLWKKE